MAPGSYSVYARIALAPGAAPGRNFGAAVFYNENVIASPSIVVSNKAYQWLRLGSFDLGQTGANLRVSDWSAAGLSVDKLAIVQDATLEAEAVAGGNIVFDGSASSSQAVTRSSVGNYIWGAPAPEKMVPGDYEVWVRAKSISTTARNFGAALFLSDVNDSLVNISVAGGGYQWYKANRFTYAGAGQTVRFSDYSDLGMSVDSLKMVRVTPFDKDSAAQALFAAGQVVLGPEEMLQFRGTAIGSQFPDRGRMALVRADANTIYAYFRQRVTTYGGSNGTAYEAYQINMGKSSDNGASFDVFPQTIVPVTTDASGHNSNIYGLATAYDPQVTKTAAGYRMVFEGQGLNCDASTITAFSADGVNNWVVQKTPAICSHLMDKGSAAVPTYFTDVETGAEYLQFVSVDPVAQVSYKYQWAMPAGGFSAGNLILSDLTQLQQYALPKGANGSWEDKNFGAGNILYENGMYYHIYEGANGYDCRSGNWGIGIARTPTPGMLNSLVRSKKNPFLLSPVTGCTVEYPQIITLPTGTYLYYWEGWKAGGDGAKTAFRRKINLK